MAITYTHRPMKVQRKVVCRKVPDVTQRMIGVCPNPACVTRLVPSGYQLVVVRVYKECEGQGVGDVGGVALPQDVTTEDT